MKKTIEHYAIALFAHILMALFLLLFFVVKARESAIAFLTLSLTIKKLNK